METAPAAAGALRFLRRACPAPSRGIAPSHIGGIAMRPWAEVDWDRLGTLEGMGMVLVPLCAPDHQREWAGSAAGRRARCPSTWQRDGTCAIGRPGRVR